MKRCKRSFYYLFVFFFLTTRSRVQMLTLNVNLEKPVSVIGEKFLGLTVDPPVLSHGNALSTKFEESIRLAKASSRGKEREEVRPSVSVVELEKSDSGENTFYGFFETIPLQGFPQGDVFVTTGNSPGNGEADYDKDNVNVPNDREAAPTLDVWTEDGNDYGLRLDETDKYFDNSKTSYDRTGSGELCQAETYQPRDTRATKKNRNLYAILDEEMINEDDANSKDCDCRVIRQSEACVCRAKRNPPESLESEANAETSSEQETSTDVDVAGIDSHHVTDVEVFSELADSPMEILKLHNESPDSKIERDANEFPRNQFDSEIVDNDSLDDSPSTTSTFNEDGDSNSPSNTTKIHRDENTFSFRNRFGETEQEETSSDSPEDVAEYTRTSWENSTPVADLNETPRPEEIDISETENSSKALVSAILSDGSIENDYNNDTTVDGVSKRPVETQVLSGTAGNTENPETPTTKNTKQEKRRIDDSSSKRRKSSDARPWETRLMNRARSLLTRRKMLDEKKEKRGTVSTLNSKLRSTGRLRERARNRTDRFDEANKKVRGKRGAILQKSTRNLVNAEEIETKTKEKKRNPSKREVNDDLADTIDRIPIYHPNEANANKENDASGETVETSSIPITEIARMRSVRERIFNSKDPQNFRRSRIIQPMSHPREPTDAIIRSRDLYENETATKRKFSNDEKKYDRSYLALVENFESPRIFRYQPNSPSEQKRSPRVLSPSPDARYYDTEHTYAYDSLRRKPYENLEIVRDSSPEIGTESNELAASREIYVIDPSVINGEPALQLLYRDPLKTRKVVYETIWKPVLYNPYKIHRTNQLERENRPPSSRDPRGTCFDYLEDLVKLQDSTKNFNTGELLRILMNALDLRHADQLFDRSTGSKENQSRDETTRLERDNQLEQIAESKENSVERKPSETSDTQRTRAKLSMVYRDRPDFLQEKSKSEESGERFDYANENTSKMLRVYTANERENENSEAIEENVNIDSEMATTLPWAKRLGRFQRQTKGQPLELQRLEQVPSSPRILTHSDSDIDDVEKSMVRKIAHEKYTQKENMSGNYVDTGRNLERSDNENRGLSSFVEESIPKVQNVVIDGLEKAQNLTGTVERLIENLDKNFNETSEPNGPRNSADPESIDVTRNTFHNAIINVKKFFTLLTGITHILHR